MKTTTTRIRSRNGARARWKLPILVGLCLNTALCLGAWAGGGEGPGPAPTLPPGVSFNSPGEEGTSLPVVNDTSGLTFVGQLRDLRGLFVSLRGPGRVVVQRLGHHRLAVTLVGDLLVELDRRVLAQGNVAVLFHGGAPYEGGLAVLQIGDSSPVLLPAERVPLPVARLAASPRAQGNLLTLDAFGQRARRAHVEAIFARDRVTMTQRSR